MLRKYCRHLGGLLVVLTLVVGITPWIGSAGANSNRERVDLTATATSPGQIDLSWSNVPGPVNYHLYRMESGGERLLSVARSRRFSDTGLVPATIYRYQVAVVSDGVEQFRSSVVSERTQLVTVTEPKPDAVTDPAPGPEAEARLDPSIEEAIEPQPDADRAGWATGVVGLAGGVFGQRSGYVVPSSGVVVLEPGTYDASALVRGHPAGTRFVLRAGVHRWTSRVEPRQDMEFHGAPGSVISGARQLTGWTREGGLWWAAHTPGLAHSSSASCRGEYRDEAAGIYLCRDPNAAFLDDKPLRQRVHKSEVDAGSYWLDYSNNRVYVGVEPAGRRVEVAVTEEAFYGSSDPTSRTGVVLKNLVVEKFGSRPQRAAINSQSSRRWRVEDVTARLNYAHGIRVSGSGGIIRGSAAVDNGQMGVSGAGSSGGGWVEGHDLLVEYTEIARNGEWAGISPGWEAGGTKWANTTGLTVRRNWVHRNYYTALWTDINNLNTLYEENLVENNDHTGIFHEISYDAVIRRNVVRGNGHRTQSSWAASAGIRVANSQRVQIYDNVVSGNWNHITLSSQSRTSHTRRFEPFDEYLLRDVLVRSNTVTMTGSGALGAVRDDGKPIFDPIWSIRFRENTYRNSSASSRNFVWNGRTLDFADWQQAGNDTKTIELDPFRATTITYEPGTRTNT